MHNAFVDPEDWAPEQIVLRGEEAKHLVAAVRAKTGDKIVLFDGRGRSAIALIASIAGKGKDLTVECKIESILPDRSPSSKLTLLQAIPKGNRMDTLVEKVTELGAWKIVPIKTERVEKQPGAKGYDGQVERWNRVGLSAAKQCGSPWIPEISKVCTLEEGVSSASGSDVFLVCVLDRDAVQLADYLRDGTGEEARNISVLIGPEGDLTDAEIDLAVKAGAIPVNFGNLVLRVETAAIYAASVLKNHFRWDAW